MTTCHRCGTQHYDRADRLPHEQPLCDQCVEIIFGLDESA